MFLFLSPYFFITMATRARLGLKLEDGSILSVYHHWDGYPEWLGVTLKERYNTKEKIAELIDGGNMSSCWSDNIYDVMTGKFIKIEDPKPNYYGGDDEAPRLDKNFDEYKVNSTMGEEFIYVFDGEWKAFEIDQRRDDDWNIIDTFTQEVKIPEPETV